MNSGETGLQTYLHVDSRSTTGVSNIQPGGPSRAKGDVQDRFEKCEVGHK